MPSSIFFFDYVPNNLNISCVFPGSILLNNSSIICNATLLDDEVVADKQNCEEYEYSGEVASWTFMMYISDSDLEYFAITDIVEMESIGSSKDVNIIVQFDRWDGYDSPKSDDESNGNWETAKRFYITRDCDGNLKDHEIHSHAVEDIGEINTGDASELVSFVEWAMKNYPAENYALDIWDHGGGVAGVAYEQSCPDFCYTFGNEPDKLSLPEIDWALKEITNDGNDSPYFDNATVSSWLALMDNFWTVSNSDLESMVSQIKTAFGI